MTKNIIQIKINALLISQLELAKIYLRPVFGFGDSENKVVNVISKIDAEEYSRLPEALLGFGETLKIGAFSYITPGAQLFNCTIGRFCSIATGVRFIGLDHPMDRVTTSTWTYGENLSALVEKDFGIEIDQNRKIKKSAITTIENDVWIGENVSIRQGIKISNGAVVGANSVVTKDVPSYCVVAGNPARIVKKRLDDDLQHQVEKSMWWNFHPKILGKLNMVEPTIFIEELSRLQHTEINNYNYKKNGVDKLFHKYGTAV